MSEDLKQSGREEDEQIRKAYAAALSGKNGEILIKDLRYYANKTSHTPGYPYTTAYKDGQRTMARNFLLLGGIDDI